MLKAAATVPQVVQAPLDELLARYWDLAYVEGREGRNVDAPNNDAQRVLSSIKQLFRAAPQPVAAPIVPSDEQIIEHAKKYCSFDQDHREYDPRHYDILEDFVGMVRALLAQSAPANVEDAPFRNLISAERTSDQSVELVFMSCRAASEFHNAALAAKEQTP